jgi:predicted secreted protein
MKKICISISVGAALVFTFCVSPLLAEEKKQEPSTHLDACEATLVKKCSDCHHLTRVCQKLGKKSKGDWRRSIKRMIRKGTVLNKEEEKMLVQCLYKEQEGAKNACKK